MAESGSMNARGHGITEHSVLAILAEALSSFPEPLLPDGSPAPSAQTAFAQTVFGQASLTGSWNGTVTLRVPVPLASSLTSALFAIPAGEISAVERADVVAELCNPDKGFSRD
jgi:hypothetical protein